MGPDDAWKSAIERAEFRGLAARRRSLVRLLVAYGGHVATASQRLAAQRNAAAIGYMVRRHILRQEADQ
jgi:hypothetical protein